MPPAGHGTMDVFHCLRKPDEVSFAGGVFVIVRCDDALTWSLLKGMGHLLSRDGQRGLVWLPRHLLGLAEQRANFHDAGRRPGS